MGAPTADERIQAAIAAAGRITFAEFMEIALYAPEVGYYTATQSGPGHDDGAARATGPARDYYTAPQVHAVFGAYLARHAARIWRDLGEPERFDIVEMGAGRGILAWDILRGLRRTAPDCWERAHYHLVERGPGPRGAQRQALANAAAHPIVTSQALTTPVTGVLLSNELLDALPAHRVRVRNGALQEIYVTLRDGRLREETGAPSCPELTAYVERLGWPPEGWRGEICLAAVTWLERVARLLERGAVITIDYGATWDELRGPRYADGTLACYHRHRVSKNPYARAGAQDITAHVNFSALMDAGTRAGLRMASYQSQAEYLTGLGIGAELAALARQPVTAETQRAKRAITDLIWPDGLGGFRVLTQEKGVSRSRDPRAGR